MVFAIKYRHSSEILTKKENLEDLPQWNLQDLYAHPESPELKENIIKTENLAIHFQKNWKNALHQSSPALLGKAIQEYEKICEELARISSFAELLYHSNTLNKDYACFYTDIVEKTNTIESYLLFFPIELNALDQETIMATTEKSELFNHYTSWIAHVRKHKIHQLDEKSEKIFLEKEITSKKGWERLFDETTAKMEFFVQGKTLLIEEALDQLKHKEPLVRAETASALTKEVQKNLHIFTLITNTLSKNLDIEKRWRAFQNIEDFRHLSNNVEHNVIECLTESVQNSFHRTSHRYYRIKARWLGMKQLNYWDRNAPFPETVEKEISWKEAHEIVVSAYTNFSPTMGNLAEKFFSHQWIDASLRKGKHSGAFCHPTAPSVHPYILLNYMGKTDDVMTLAHEIGHGIHQILSSQQGILMASSPLTVAETASVFGETLTFHHLLEKICEPKKRKMILAKRIEDMLNTIVRQIAFYQFERNIHNERQKGELTSNKIGDLWIKTQHESLGDAIHLNEGYEMFWSFIPHFIHAPFYVYAYAFGNCLANTLYMQYQKNQTDFIEKYLNMLQQGGKKHHKDLLSPFGLDATKHDFWEEGLSYIESLINTLESLDKV